MAVKYVFVTGGVVSGLGKGITAASLGRLLKARGYQVTMQKFDPYINIDPGTMNPIQHGEVFVTDDGTETDLDLGHYERFIDESLDKNSNVTTGKIYWSVHPGRPHAFPDKETSPPLCTEAESSHCCREEYFWKKLPDHNRGSRHQPGSYHPLFIHRRTIKKGSPLTGAAPGNLKRNRE